MAEQQANPLDALMLDESEDALFDFKPFDPSEGRATLVKNAARSLRQVNKEVGVRGEPDWVIGHEGRIRYKPVLNGKPIRVSPAQKTDYFPTTTQQFGALVEQFTAAVEAGAYDDQIEAAYEGTRPVAATPARSATKSGTARVYDNVTKASFKINGLSRGANPKSEKEIREALLKEGFTKEDIDAAYKRRADKKKA